MRTIMRSGLGAQEEAGITELFHICSTGIAGLYGCKSLSDALFYERFNFVPTAVRGNGIMSIL